ncbi:MAG: hypothetical protein HKO81_05490 [Flavobacteriaceae bacterium]|nr:hypothetical protein [Flavobacteriaceae bacterium]
MKYALTFIVLMLSICSAAQDISSNYITKKVALKDTIQVDSVSINSSRFILKTNDQRLVDSTYYKVDFGKAILTLNKPLETDSVIIEYLRYPEFLTKKYFQLDKGIIVENTDNMQQFYKLAESNKEDRFIPFDGLSTSGSISRGVTVGNNQNSVLNSELDLQISGKLNKKVSLRASIQDANIPLQESGYSQRLDEFDQVFIELFSENWNIRAGDIDLENNQSYFAEFSKRVQGLSLNANLKNSDSKTNVFAAGALVRGQFTTSQFTAQEGNQGPYKLQGPNNELFVLVVSGSETVYVNGVALERGENKDYIIDYNAGEVIFNSTFPITSEMRITVDYQFSERNYSRIVAYGGASHVSDKFSIGASIYSENDAKNQPLLQNLSSDQVQLLSEAGDDRSQMVAPSEVEETFNENRILYRKELINGVEAFVFSSNPEDELFSVRFTLVGDNQGNYILSNTSAINNIYEYVEPLTGIPQGNYEPVIQLIAPTKLQLAVLNGSYNPSEKTNIYFEAAGSKNDLNLFSGLDDEDNDGFAGKLKFDQAVIKRDSTWNLEASADMTFIQENFRTIQRLNKRAEFNRDWNLEQSSVSQNSEGFGNQILFSAGVQLYHLDRGNAKYEFEHLNYSQNFNGNRHILFANLNMNRWHIFSNTSLLNANSLINRSNFTRSFNRITYRFGKQRIGSKISLEDNEQRAIETDELTPLSQKFMSYEVFYGIGDSTKVFAEVGYINRVNDSIRNNEIVKVNTSKTYYLKSKLINSNKTNLSVYLNYRKLKSEDNLVKDENSLNSRLQFNQKLFDQVVNWNTVFETNSGVLPQQDFTYVEVDEGQGAYTWIDYNENGIQELEEFEIAQFQDQGTYVRVLLPNQVFIKTHQNRLSQLLTINPQQGSSNKSKSRFWKRLYNQTSYLIDKKIRRNSDNFDINPFKDYGEEQLGLNLSFRNVLFYNRGKQRYTTSYTYLSNKSKNLLSVGSIGNNLESHQFNFVHKFAKTWLLNTFFIVGKKQSSSENFVSKNFNIDEIRFNPKLSYLFDMNSRFDVFYQYANKDNTIGLLESLDQQKYGVSFSFSKNQKSAINGEFNYFSNKFTGDQNSPVAYQMMEGLQPGKNFTWSLLAQKKLTKFLDLNLNYFGRKTETSKTIHTGTIQLKAYF